MKIQIVGGNFDKENGRHSGIVNKMYDTIKFLDYYIDTTEIINGGNINQLPKELNSDLIIWMPNISNEEEKNYPIKKKGSVLICSKLMHDGVKITDAVSRIFKLHGNAVICIYPPIQSSLYKFELRDALNNIWYNGYSIDSLIISILSFTIFTSKAKRIQTTQNNLDKELYKDTFNIYKQDLQQLININKRLQNHIQTSCGNRFFGNLSTRCQKLFPTLKINQGMFVSPRNINKESITPEDMILYINDTYYGDRKPSVDSPTQWRLYNNLPNINYMIHGHATFIHTDIETTQNYCLCGDINEVNEVLNLVGKNEYAFCINLKNHGFLIGADTIDHLEKTIDNIINNQDINIEITNSNE